ncbi:hypothetical protein ABW19_dt0200058 [Dactylella cylindrospora]|nr:hypothetical protein ABW19_dt0200058 [Dactylella cylindrospora]
MERMRWDGRQFVVTLKDGGWWETIKMLWKYGLSPIRTQSLVKKTVGQFLKMYEEPVFPWKSLTQTAIDLELTSATSSTGLAFLKANSIYAPFTTDLIQASTRVNYGSNLGHIHGLETMVAMSTDGAVAITGGNWQIFDKMVQSSKAIVLLETAVTSIEKAPASKSWIVKASKSTGENIEHEYDEVIIATPYQFSNISSSSIQAPEVVKYKELFVTLFASPYRLSPKYFHYDGEILPDMLLTTLPTDADQTVGDVGLTKFWSVNILRVVDRKLENGVTRKEYLYKIFSPEEWSNEKIYEMLGVSTDKEESLTWVYRKTWNAYPIAEPKSVFQEQQLDFGLWYTAGLEPFISCMETMSLSGKNVAANIVESWAAARVAESTKAQTGNSF